MAKGHFEYYIEDVRNMYTKSVSYANDINEKFDKLIVWIVGFSISGIALLISQSDKLEKYSSIDLSIVVSFLVLAIITGVLGRVLQVISENLSYPIIMHIENTLLAQANPFKATKLKGDESAQSISVLLKQDFDIDAKGLESRIANTPMIEMEELNKQSRKVYETTVEWATKQRTGAYTSVTELFNKTHNFTEKEKKRNKNSKLYPRTVRWTAKIAFYFDSSSCTLFLLAISIFAVIFIVRIN